MDFLATLYYDRGLCQLTFIAIVAPTIRTQPDLLACVISGGLALAGRGLPWNGGLLIAAIGGILAGWLVQQINRQGVK